MESSTIAHQLPPPRQVAAVGEQRIVGNDRSHPHNQRIYGVAHTMHFGARFAAADPEMTTGLVLRGRDAAIERSGNFHGDVGKEGGDEFCVAVVKPAGLFLQHTGADLHPGRTQAGDTFTVHLRVGVGSGHHHPRDPGGYQRVRAGSGSSLVAARFEGHIGGRTLGQRAGLLKGNHLGVVAAVIFMEAFTHQLVAPNQDAADGRVG